MHTLAFEQVHRFWFGRYVHGTLPVENVDRWFTRARADAIDGVLASLTQPFGNLEDFAKSDLQHFQQDARSCLVLILLLDKFPHFLQRSSDQAFVDCQRIALRCCKEGLRLGLANTLTPVELVFFYGPLLYSRNVLDRQQGLSLLQHLLDQTSAPEHPQHEQYDCVLRSLSAAIMQNSKRRVIARH